MLFSALSYIYNGVDTKLDMLRTISNLVSGSIMIYMYCLDELNITDSETIVNKNDNCFQYKTKLVIINILRGFTTG